MKTFSTLIILLVTLVVSCQRQHVIDDVFPWPSSGIEEADSLLLAYEYHRNYHSLPNQSEIIEKLDSIHRANPDNELIKLRLAYLKYCQLPLAELSKAMATDSILNHGDSVKYPYDWHMFKSLRINMESNLAIAYNMVIDNIGYFQSVGAETEEGKNLILAGNIMLELSDTIKALDYYKQALDIYTSLKCTEAIVIANNNIAILSPKNTKDSIYRALLNNPEVIKSPRAHTLILQNYFVSSDSVQYIDKALQLYKDNEIDHTMLQLAMALKGDYMVHHGDPKKGLEILASALDIANKIPNNERAIHILHNFLADAYYHCEEKDSSIAEFERARVWRDSLDKIYNRPKVYALDAKARIEMAERTAKLERERIIGLWIISVLCLATIVGLLISHIKRKNVEKKYQEILTEEKMQRQIQSIQAQAKVMEESDRLMEEIAEKIEELKNSNNISEEGVDNLSRVLRIHKSNEDNRQGFLKVQKELDSRFLIRLKEDYPTLSESQLKLASLIAIGLDSRQIGSILNIEQASVHKSRYRLRTRLGLKTDQSLEEFLRRYNRNIPIDQ